MADKTYDSTSAMLAGDQARKFPTESGRNYPRQGTLIIRAATKKAAAEKLTKLGYPWMKPHELRVGMGDSLEALERSGVLDSGDLFVVADYGQIVRVTLVDGKPVATYYGKTKRITVIEPVDQP